LKKIYKLRDKEENTFRQTFIRNGRDLASTFRVITEEEDDGFDLRYKGYWLDEDRRKITTFYKESFEEMMEQVNDCKEVL
jgi:hypothetical protein